MVKPVCKIEVYTAAVLDHTITADALNVEFTEIVTDGISNFSFTVPTNKGGTAKYDDIALHDKVKIWIGYGSVSGTANFIGYIHNISGVLNSNQGYCRVITGLSQGEVLLDRLKTDKRWVGIGASTIVASLASDLSLGAGDIVVDATALTLEVESKPYFDLLREISDYWFSAGTQVKKDFFVDVDNDLVWKVRPITTYTALTLEVGKNILSYEVTQDRVPIKNNIEIYGSDGYAQSHIPGSLGRTYPTDKDGWTENDSAGWTTTYGTITWLNATKKVGDWYMAVTSEDVAGTHYINVFRTGLGLVARGKRGYKTLNFFAGVSAGIVTFVVDIANTTTTNNYETDITQNAPWVTHNFDLGPNQEYDAVHNTNGEWTVNNTPNWYDVNRLRFTGSNAIAFTVYIDGLHFGHGRWRYTATDATSITAYGQRDLELVDDKLLSDTDCEKRAKTLLYQRKDPPKQITVVARGDMLIQPGDRRRMTIAKEGISTVDFDLFKVTHRLNKQTGFTSIPVMVNSANIREPIINTPNQLLSDLNRKVRLLALKERWQ